VPLALSRLGSVVGEAGGVVLHIDVRPPPASAASPGARGLCFSMAVEEWPSDSAAVAALASRD
jgi:hypothetical protein